MKFPSEGGKKKNLKTKEHKVKGYRERKREREGENDRRVKKKKGGLRKAPVFYTKMKTLTAARARKIPGHFSYR